MIYAPMSGMGGIVYDKDAMYIDLGGSYILHHVRNGMSFLNIFMNNMTPNVCTLALMGITSI